MAGTNASEERGASTFYYLKMEVTHLPETMFLIYQSSS
jgi:hypothetical protein